MITKSALEKLLKREIIEIQFNKKDGTKRTMLCSLKHEFLPPLSTSSVDTKKKVKRENDEVLAAWDLEKDAFRSFRLNSIIDYQVVSEGYEL